MRISWLRRQWRYRASAARVFACMTDIAYFERELRRERDDAKLSYDKQTPFGEGKRIVVSVGKSAFALSVVRNLPERELVVDLRVRGRRFERLGILRLSSELDEAQGVTTLRTHVEGERRPGLFWRVFIRVLLFLMLRQARDAERRFAEYVEAG